MSGRIQVKQVVTHGGKKLEENYKNVTGKYQQEIYCGISNDSVEKVAHPVNTHSTSMSRRVYDDEECRAVFNEGVGCCNVDTERKEKNVPYISESPAKATLMVRDPWNMQNWYSSKGRSGNTITFGIGVCYGHFFQRPARRDILGRDPKWTIRKTPKANCTRLQKER